MVPQQRMSPLTAFFLGLFGVGAVAIGSIAVVSLYTLRIIDSNVGAVFRLASDTVDGLPGLLRELPPALGDLLRDRRDPRYASHIKVDVRFAADEIRGGLRPVMTVTNNGEEVVSLLAVRVVGLDAEGRPAGEWTEVIATPLAFDNDWRGPLLPGETRHVLLSRTHRFVNDPAGTDLSPAVEIADVRIWRPEEGTGQGL